MEEAGLRCQHFKGLKLEYAKSSFASSELATEYDVLSPLFLNLLTAVLRWLNGRTVHLWASAPKVLESKTWQWGVLKAGKACRAINVNFSNRSKISSVVIKDLQATSNREFSLLVFGDFIVKRRTKEIMGLAGFFFS